MKRYVWAISLLWARHIAGAELVYTCLDPQQGRYEITLRLYRDCSDPLGAEYDNPIVLYIFRGDGTLHATQNVILSQFSPWGATGVEGCALVTPTTCLEDGYYKTELVLPPSVSGYHLAWARCCRNSAITNLQNPLDMGVTFLARIPPAADAACNSMPLFQQRPPFFLCAGRDFYFDHSATDPDGDSLVYVISHPYHSLNAAGLGAVNPNTYPGGSPVVGPSNPMGPPPYQYVTYAPGYSYLQPFGPGGTFSIDPRRGLLHVRAPAPGLYVVAISVLEYRNGKFLSENKRDMQFYVVACKPPTTPPWITHNLTGLTVRGDTIDILPQTPFCFTFEIQDSTLEGSLQYALSLPAGISTSVLNVYPLVVQVCPVFDCQNTTQVYPLVIRAWESDACPGYGMAWDTVWVRVLDPPPFSLQFSWERSPPWQMSQGVWQIPLDSTSCWQYRITYTPESLNLGFSVSTSPTILSLQNRILQRRPGLLIGELCLVAGCEKLSGFLEIFLTAQLSQVCSPQGTHRETLRYEVILPQNPVPLISFYDLDLPLHGNAVEVTAESTFCVGIRIRDSFPLGRHRLEVLTGDGVMLLQLNPMMGQDTLWEAILCARALCEAMDTTVVLVVRVRDSVSCAQVGLAQETLYIRVRSRPIYPIVIEVPYTDSLHPWVVQVNKPICLPYQVRDTAGNGGSLYLSVEAPFPTQTQPLQGQGVLNGQVCFVAGCTFVGKGVIPITFSAQNFPPCTKTFPTARDTLWLQVIEPPENRPPLLWRPEQSPASVSIEGTPWCYEIWVSDPDSFVLLDFAGVGPAFEKDFYYGSHFRFEVETLSVNTFRVRLCALLNCYAQQTIFPVIFCVLDTTACQKKLEVCDTLTVAPGVCALLIPNVFTPNGDGINDLFHPYGVLGIRNYTLWIYDRWGNLLTSTQTGWDGRDAPEGVYYYVLEGELFSGWGPPLRFRRAGSFSLLR
ncbi:MAG: gliding motility-associated C-terminal domain-containing protein [Bacteroidia bacterium]